MSKTLSQIATALEADKTAIRQAILSGGGTCPAGNGFDDFASDIGTIPAGGSFWDSMRLVQSTSATPPLKSYLSDSSGRGTFAILSNTTTTSEISVLYKIAHGYDDSQYLTVREYRSKTSQSTLQIDLVATFCNTASYTSTLGTVTIYNFYWVPVYIPSYSTTSYSDCIDAGYDRCHFFGSSQTSLTDWHRDSWQANYIDTSSDTYNNYIMGVYVYLKWKSSNKNGRYMFLHCDKLGSAII